MQVVRLFAIAPSDAVLSSWVSMIRSFLFVLSFFVLIFAFPANSFAQVQAYVPSPVKVGHGRYRVFFLNIFDAVLYTPNEKWNEKASVQANASFEMQIRYLRDLTSKRIADNNIEEIRKQGFRDEKRLAKWHRQMLNNPNVKKNDSLVGVLTKTRETIFFKDRKEIGRIKDPEFGPRFFSIWLGTKASDRNLRRGLLGLK